MKNKKIPLNSITKTKVNIMRPQVTPSHYIGKKYDSKERFACYWHQINEVLKTKPKSVLEIGVGNRFVSDYLKKQGIKVTTADIDKRLKPDVVCSVTDLSKKFKENSFDTILCCEVLEHIPFSQFEKCLKEMSKITKRNVIISLPYDYFISLFIHLRLPFLKDLKLNLRIPNYHKVHIFSGEHYWEVDKLGYSIKKIKSIVEEQFKINNFFYSKDNPYHLFFALNKR